MNNELLPCPFCGGENRIIPQGVVMAGFGYWCTKCGNQSQTFVTESEAIDSANRRYLGKDSHGNPICTGDNIKLIWENGGEEYWIASTENWNLIRPTSNKTIHVLPQEVINSSTTL